MPTSANKRQVSGKHYQASIQCWDYIIANGLDYLEGNVVKYVTRHRKKNGLIDLRKAEHYLAKLIEVEKAKLKRDRARHKANSNHRAVAARAKSVAPGHRRRKIQPRGSSAKRH